MKQQNPRRATPILKKNNNVGSITLPNIKQYCKVLEIKAAWYWHKNRYINLWNRTERLEIKDTYMEN